MAYLPELKFVTEPQQKQIVNFKGYSKAPVIDDGEMRDMLNLSSDNWPNLSQRKPRGLYTIHNQEIEYNDPECMLVRDGRLAVITKEVDGSGAAFFYGCEMRNGRYVPKGFSTVEINTTLAGQHKMVAINKKICIWPEKIWFDVETTQCGSLDAFQRRNASASNPIVITNDTTTVCVVKFNGAHGYDQQFSKNDAVDLVFNVNGTEHPFSAVIQDVSTDSLTFIGDSFLGLMDGETELSITSGSVSVSRSCPDLEFVMESNNRLWGCADNTIYSCKLGDPTNWNYYQALAADSYAIEVGTGGKWTGCCPYSNHLLFFKENCIHKLYGTQPSNYQIQTAECYGLEAGSDKSVCVINETVFYKSKLGIMAYTGVLPEHISSNLGTQIYSKAIAGTDGVKYYVSLKRPDDTRELFVFDLDKKLWHKEDNIDVLQFTYLTNDRYNDNVLGDGVPGKNQLLYLEKQQGGETRLCSVDPYVPFAGETVINWSAQLGEFTEWMEQRKIYSKIKMRVKMDEGSDLSVYIKHDDGDWMQLKHFYTDQTKFFVLPIVPVRCDRFSIRLEGTGNCTVEALTRTFREGSDR